VNERIRLWSTRVHTSADMYVTCAFCSGSRPGYVLNNKAGTGHVIGYVALHWRRCPSAADSNLIAGPYNVFLLHIYNLSEIGRTA
jgi:hypothetical protein